MRAKEGIIAGMSESNDSRIEVRECLRKANRGYDSQNRWEWLVLAKTWLLLAKTQEIVENGIEVSGQELTHSDWEFFSALQSSSASRFIACALGFFTFTQQSTRPDRYDEPSRFETMPSQPSLRIEHARRVLRRDPPALLRSCKWKAPGGWERQGPRLRSE